MHSATTAQPHANAMLMASTMSAVPSMTFQANECARQMRALDKRNLELVRTIWHTFTALSARLDQQCSLKSAADRSSLELAAGKAYPVHYGGGTYAIAIKTPLTTAQDLYDSIIYRLKSDWEVVTDVTLQDLLGMSQATFSKYVQRIQIEEDIEKDV